MIRRTRVLVVDDHIHTRQGLKAVLELTPDFEVVGEAGDGYMAVELAGVLKPDLVLMDVNMPGINGYEAALEMRRKGIPSQVVFLASFNGSSGKKINVPPAEVVIEKGISPWRLLEIIREARSNDGEEDA